MSTLIAAPIALHRPLAPIEDSPHEPDPPPPRAVALYAALHSAPHGCRRSEDALPSETGHRREGHGLFRTAAITATLVYRFITIAASPCFHYGIFSKRPYTMIAVAAAPPAKRRPVSPTEDSPHEPRFPPPRFAAVHASRRGKDVVL